MQETLNKIADGFVEFYTGLYSGLMYYHIGIELPKHLNLRPNAIFGEHKSVPHGSNELLEYAQAFEDISRKFAEWAKYLRERETPS